MKLIVEEAGRREWADAAQAFCREFVRDNGRKKYIFGCNAYGHDLVAQVKVDGFIDDFSKNDTFLGLPIVKTSAVPKDAMVLIASGGSPFTVMRHLDAFGLQHLDYFAFYKWSGLPVRELVFNEGFATEFAANRAEYDRVFAALADDESRQVFQKLVNFRVSHDLDNLRGFTSREDVQYFEPFLALARGGETFVDVGCFDGHTSLEFIKHCPDYRAIHVFEPEQKNIDVCKARLAGRPNVHFHACGLSDRKERLHFSAGGSTSHIDAQGELVIEVDRLDDVINDTPTFVKMDIEGAELKAIAGAKATIAAAHPRLAISVYHNAGDFWRIPQAILAVRGDYDLYMRHYTETIYETVMFFIPKH
ncbi:FkbM family methyltransferase [Bradyrhizobium sp. U87765 SZCCT0131]|uniref:FkbM family methyltransferase n=1 Tax=unclassified Bradyrhizobium TaxID=2631580 RepID=UPI001BA6CB86|nr:MULTISPECIES: FkbM family methyltransferase [unclassified Bradyrhizobium]MBR1219661.1 FkbM family methyltransferase [Bradyrhizobium sp. U87765 SZCCT0131]MBR1262312.1 FkbM family methyltransferase [Bradyrhizobium sp. U87765 SZCCT0134]MBR1308505.1 FkbM family methyltransferase [Bradyrhizobium sp. U87765 SZCCT0110]MBR1318094.1 FkbM family methyltransferase [Bradyrhizobium sp. U87765 SZCCT0109]MBR1351797.1 FkbM family methyltransferase [Bradyrhizobium sp. U87765 SZCCT0048]